MQSNDLQNRYQLSAWLTILDWESNFSPKVLEKGKAAAAEKLATVTEVESGNNHWRLNAVVKEGNKVFRVTVFVEEDDYLQKGIMIPECDCRGGATACRHAAAALQSIVNERSGALRLHPFEENPQDHEVSTLPYSARVWLEGVSELPMAPIPGKPVGKEKPVPGKLWFRLSYDSDGDCERGGICELQLVNQYRLKDGSWSEPVRPSLSAAPLRFPKYFSADDERFVRDMMTLGSGPTSYEVEGRFWGQLIEEILHHGAVVWESNPDMPLRDAEPRAIKAGWKYDAEGNQQTVLRFADTDSPAAILNTEPRIYINPEEKTWGQVVWKEAIPPKQWLQAPRVEPELVDAFREELESVGLSKNARPHVVETVRIFDAAPQLVLHLECASVVRKDREEVWKQNRGFDLNRLNLAKVGIRYGDVVLENMFFENDDTQVSRFEKGKIYQVTRDLFYEEELNEDLDALGFEAARALVPYGEITEEHAGSVTFTDAEEAEGEWLDFLQAIPNLRKRGWEVVVGESFEYQVMEPDGYWGDFEETSGIDFLRFDYGVEINGQKHSLLEALVEYLKRQGPSFQLEQLVDAEDGEEIFVKVGNDLVAIPAKQLGRILSAVTELFGTLSEGGVFLHPLAAARAAEMLPEATGQTARRLRNLAKRLNSFDGIREAKIPTTLKAELRPYQLEGVSWMQFLREHQLGGVLADDMGLGKTVQTIANLLIERRARRAEHPTLIVAPTSVISNWESECEKFAPSLYVLTLQGPERKEYFELMPEADIVLTSYALLARDAEVLTEQDFHYVILDEAQAIKNPKAKVAHAARKLKANHRLCLTGTPMENHLGELWSLYHFLMPGFLGSEEAFRAVWRRPIENNGDESRRLLLRQKISSVLLRRLKDDVLEELPPRTNVLRSVSLDKSQLELYEAVRATMNKKVRDAIKARGLGRSQIVVLDALLKLRQICCHPRLLKMKQAEKVKVSAKLEEFRELIRSLVSDGRRVLVFSQFTSMLAILEEVLEEEGISWLKLTGQTRPAGRKKAIDAFQNLEAPVFLISLKAGGSGLNLMAADTVIHYDPWWNPAVEEQATGRAHRMGQKNPVFVYRLVTEGAIEERILELQEKKSEIANAILSGGSKEKNQGFAIGKEDLERLLAPVD